MELPEPDWHRPELTVGDLPPSSSVILFIVSAPARRITLPTAVEPVKGDLRDIGMAG